MRLLSSTQAICHQSRPPARSRVPTARFCGVTSPALLAPILHVPTPRVLIEESVGERNRVVPPRAPPKKANPADFRGPRCREDARPDRPKSETSLARAKTGALASRLTTKQKVPTGPSHATPPRIH